MYHIDKNIILRNVIGVNWNNNFNSFKAESNYIIVFYEMLTYIIYDPERHIYYLFLFQDI